MRAVEYVLHALALLISVFALMSGIGLFLAGLLTPGVPPIRNYALSATSVTAGYYLLIYALGG